MSTTQQICETEKIAAFIEGDLRPAAHEALAEHLKQCAGCASELQLQRQFMCELDSAFANTFEMTVPQDFARVVAVRAESDMRGVRDPEEHKRALRLCVILGLTAFGFLGVTSSRATLADAQALATKILGVFGLLGKTLYDAAAGFTVVLRVLSGGLVADSRFAGLAALLFGALAIGLLSLLIIRYHRTRLSE